jgi:hypothetical protein
VNLGTTPRAQLRQGPTRWIMNSDATLVTGYRDRIFGIDSRQMYYTGAVHDMRANQWYQAGGYVQCGPGSGVFSSILPLPGAPAP